MRLLRGVSSHGRVPLRPLTLGLLGHRYVLMVPVPARGLGAANRVTRCVPTGTGSSMRTEEERRVLKSLRVIHPRARRTHPNLSPPRHSVA